MAWTLTEAVVKIGAPLAKLSSDLAGAEKMVTAAAKKMQSIGKKLVIGGAALVAPLVLAATSAIKLGTEFSKVATLGVGGLDELRKGVIDISNRFAIAAIDIVPSLYAALSAGIPRDSAIMVLEQAARGAKAGVGDLSGALDLGTSLLNAYNLPASEMERIMGQAVVAVRAGKTTISELGGSVGRAAGQMQIAGVSSEEFLAAIAALTVTGASASEQVSALKQVVAGIIAPTAEAREAAEGMGLEFNAAALKADGLQGFIKKVGDATEGSAEKTTKLFGSVEAFNAVAGLAGAQAGTFSEALAGMEDAVTTLAEAEQLAIDNDPGFKWAQLKTKAVNLSTAIGTSLLPALDKVVMALTPIVEAISKWIDEHPKLTTVLATSAFVLGVFAVAVGGVTLAVGTLALAIKALIGPALFGAFIVKVGLLSAAMVILGGKLLLIAGVGGAGWAVGRWIDTMLKKLDFLKAAIEGLFDLFFKLEKLFGVSPFDGFELGERTRRAVEGGEVAPGGGPASSGMNVSITLNGSATEDDSDRIVEALLDARRRGRFDEAAMVPA